MIVLAFFGGFLVLMVVAAMIYDRRTRRLQAGRRSVLAILPIGAH